MRIGVLALQGAVREHLGSLNRCGSEAVAVKKTDELRGVDALLIPGGESTTIWKLMEKYGFTDAVKEFSLKGRPIFGTCAGLIILAGDIEGEGAKLNLIDISVVRNAFGRQVDSFESELDVSDLDGGSFKGVFIRAPFIDRVGPSVTVMSRYQDKIVMARNDGVMVSSFHPELTGDDRIHKYFIEEMAKGG